MFNMRITSVVPLLIGLCVAEEPKYQSDAERNDVLIYDAATTTAAYSTAELNQEAKTITLNTANDTPIATKLIAMGQETGNFSPTRESRPQSDCVCPVVTVTITATPGSETSVRSRNSYSSKHHPSRAGRVASCHGPSASVLIDTQRDHSHHGHRPSASLSAASDPSARVRDPSGRSVQHKTGHQVSNTAHCRASGSRSRFSTLDSSGRQVSNTAHTGSIRPSIHPFKSRTGTCPSTASASRFSSFGGTSSVPSSINSSTATPTSVCLPGQPAYTLSNSDFCQVSCLIANLTVQSYEDCFSLCDNDLSCTVGSFSDDGTGICELSAIHIIDCTTITSNAPSTSTTDAAKGVTTPIIYITQAQKSISRLQPGQDTSVTADSVTNIAPPIANTGDTVEATSIANANHESIMLLPGATSPQWPGQTARSDRPASVQATAAAAVPTVQGISPYNGELTGIFSEIGVFGAGPSAANDAVGQGSSYVQSLYSTSDSDGSAESSWNDQRTQENGQSPNGRYSAEWQAASSSSTQSYAQQSAPFTPSPVLYSKAGLSDSTADTTKFTGEASVSMVASTITALLIVLAIMVAL
ncbi:hypothetical protein MRB53_041154 [Persea americana]|nr:hypothetical protein MRB53_041154 [Persea americana]